MIKVVSSPVESYSSDMQTFDHGVCTHWSLRSLNMVDVTHAPPTSAALNQLNRLQLASQIILVYQNKVLLFVINRQHR